MSLCIARFNAYHEARQFVHAARVAVHEAAMWGAWDRAARAAKLLEAADHLIAAEKHRDLARAARRAASTQHTADGGDEEE